MHSMSLENNFEVKFEEDASRKSMFSFKKDSPKIVQLVIKYSGGSIKDEKQATYVLLVFVIVLFIAMFLLFFGGGRNIPKAALENPEYGLLEAD